MGQILSMQMIKAWQQWIYQSSSKITKQGYICIKNMDRSLKVQNFTLARAEMKNMIMTYFLNFTQLVEIQTQCTISSSTRRQDENMKSSTRRIWSWTRERHGAKCSVECATSVNRSWFQEMSSLKSITHTSHSIINLRIGLLESISENHKNLMDNKLNLTLSCLNQNNRR